MKQHITQNQLSEISTQDIAKLLNENIEYAEFILEDHGGSFFTIGRMIEILINDYMSTGKYKISGPLFDVLDTNICDKLWLAVKNIL
jgi:hypothetical protein